MNGELARVLYLVLALPSATLQTICRQGTTRVSSPFPYGSPRSAPLPIYALYPRSLDRRRSGCFVVANYNNRVQK